MTRHLLMVPKPGRMPRAPSTSSWKPTGRSTTRPRACLAKDRDVRADVLRLQPTLRALEASYPGHDQSAHRRMHVRHVFGSAHLTGPRAASIAQDGHGHGLQTMPVRSDENGENYDGSNHLAEIIRRRQTPTRWTEPTRIAAARMISPWAQLLTIARARRRVSLLRARRVARGALPWTTGTSPQPPSGPFLHRRSGPFLLRH